MNILGKKRLKIKMVHEDDLKEYLVSLGVYQDVLDKKVHCNFCGNVITLKNLEVIFPEEGKIYFICSKTQCVSRLKHAR